METVRTLLPQLHDVRPYPEATPPGRPGRCGVPGERFLQLGHPPFEHGSALDHLALVADDGTPAGPRRARLPIGVGLGVIDLLHRARRPEPDGAPEGTSERGPPRRDSPSRSRPLSLSRSVKKTRPRWSRPRNNTIRADGIPSAVAVATAIASGMVSPAPRAASSHVESWAIGSGSTDASSMTTVWPPRGAAGQGYPDPRSSTRGLHFCGAKPESGDMSLGTRFRRGARWATSVAAALAMGLLVTICVPARRRALPRPHPGYLQHGRVQRADAGSPSAVATSGSATRPATPSPRSIR